MREFEDYCWRDLLTPDMEKIYAAYHRERGLSSRPAVVVIHPHQPFGAVQSGWQDTVLRLVDTARSLGLKVIHSVPPGAALETRIAARAGEPLCLRTTESAFFFADLEAHLTRSRSNGVILCGAPTSGAVRATAVESKSFGYKTAIAEDATGDEASLLHKVALFDVAHKYADVMTADEIIDALRIAHSTGVA
ncbi:MAG: N-carbamoylsarcosine amidase [Xanthobacteraceae bacterium]|jgi:hypothetical protein|nr:N-carbamoylsarcosine amidase [Xanthobacteraceae bacterium]